MKSLVAAVFAPPTEPILCSPHVVNFLCGAIKVSRHIFGPNMKHVSQSRDLANLPPSHQGSLCLGGGRWRPLVSGPVDYGGILQLLVKRTSLCTLWQAPPVCVLLLLFIVTSPILCCLNDQLLALRVGRERYRALGLR